MLRYVYRNTQTENLHNDDGDGDDNNDNDDDYNKINDNNNSACTILHLWSRQLNVSQKHRTPPKNSHLTILHSREQIFFYLSADCTPES